MKLKLIAYAVITITLGSLGIYTFTNFMERHNLIIQMKEFTQEKRMTQNEVLKLIQSFPKVAREAVLQAIKDGKTHEEIREVYAYYKEYSNIEEKE